MINVRIEWKPEKLLRVVARAQKRNAVAIGKFIRVSARSAIKKIRGRRSKPGSPPFSPTGRLRDSIYYAVDGASVFIGPAKYHWSYLAPPPPHTIPELLEFGGTTKGYAGRRPRYTIKARPFMGPAAEKGLKDLKRKWKDAVR